MSEEISGDISKKIVALLLVLAIVFAVVGAYNVYKLSKLPPPPTSSSGVASVYVYPNSASAAAKEAATKPRWQCT